MGEGSPDIVIENGKIHVVSVGRDTTAVWYRFWEPDTYVEDIDKPENISLLKAYPNPFNNLTKISFSLREQSFATIKIYDVLGREIEAPGQSYLPSGQHSFTWNASDQPSGIYFAKLSTPESNQTIKLILLK